MLEKGTTPKIQFRHCAEAKLLQLISLELEAWGSTCTSLLAPSPDKEGKRLRKRPVLGKYIKLNGKY